MRTEASRPAWRRVGALHLPLCLVIVPMIGVSACGGDRGRQNGSSDQAADADPSSSGWAIVEDLRIGTVDGPAETSFGSLSGVYPSYDGGIWVFDGLADELRFFDDRGRFQKSIGGPGEGPGEFASSGFRGACAFLGPEGEIWVEDALRRWQRFDGNGGLLGQIRVTRTVHCGRRIWTLGGRFFVFTTELDERTGERRSMFIVHEMLQDGELSTIDTVAIPSVPPTPSVEWVNPTRTVSSIQPIPFVHRSRWIVGPDGNFWVTEGDGSYSIRRVSAHGDLLGAFQREYTPVPIPSRIRRDSIESFRQEGRIALDGVDEDRVPEVYPPFDNYFVGTDGVLWVRRSAENGAAALDLFGSDGEYRGEVAVPRDFERIRVEHATAEALFGVFHDDLGVSYAVRLRIVPPH